MKVSYVNLTNRSSAFLDWLEFEASPLVAGRFINHLNVGSTMLWTNSWSGERLSGAFPFNPVGVDGSAKRLRND